MSEREDNVYKAKLAEQAERYDGEWNIFPGDLAGPDGMADDPVPIYKSPLDIPHRVDSPIRRPFREGGEDPVSASAIPPGNDD